MIALDAITEARLTAAASRLGATPDALAARAIGSYLEDLDDYTVAANAFAELAPADRMPLEDMKRELGLAG